jgi:hypothetical protein
MNCKNKGNDTGIVVRYLINVPSYILIELKAHRLKAGSGIVIWI